MIRFASAICLSSMIYMFLSFTTVVAAATTATDDDKGGGIQVNQIDLLSGVSALLVILVGIVQIWPTPAQLCRPSLKEFLDWLKLSIEQDLFTTLYTCERNCETHKNHLTPEMFERRFRSKLDNNIHSGCVGSSFISADTLTEIILASGNSYTFEELAVVARYPKLHKLRRAIKVLRLSPSIGKRIVLYQWLVVSIAYLFDWIFLDGLPRRVTFFLSGFWNVVRRVFGRLPIEPCMKHRLALDYHIAKLAVHCLISDHIPIVRYSIYYLLLSLAGIQLSTESVGIQLNTDLAGKPRVKAGIKKGTENNEEDEAIPFEYYWNSMVSDVIWLAWQISADECSTANLLYAISLHSLRALMLCAHIGFPPPHVILGSFDTVKLGKRSPHISVRNDKLEAVFQSLYMFPQRNKPSYDANLGLQKYLHLRYSMLSMKLQNPMGDLITDSTTMHIILNAFLRVKKKDSNQLYIDNILVNKELVGMFFNYYNWAFETTGYIVDNFYQTNPNWGINTWLLYLFFEVYKTCALADLIRDYPDVYPVPYPFDFKEFKHTLFQSIGSSFGTYDHRQAVGNNQTKSWLDPDESNWVLFDSISPRLTFGDITRNASPPLWCVCKDHCRGICTLITKELILDLKLDTFDTMPYRFLIVVRKQMSDCETPAISASANPAPTVVTAQNNNDYNDELTENAIISDPSLIYIKGSPKPPRLGSKETATFDYFRNSYEMDTDRLFCVCDPHKLFSFIPGGIVTQIVKSKRSTSTISNQLSTLVSKSLIYKWWHSLNLRHRSSQHNSRINFTVYLLSELLYENSVQMVATFNNKLFTIHLPDGHENPIFSEQREAFIKLNE